MKSNARMEDIAIPIMASVSVPPTVAVCPVKSVFLHSPTLQFWSASWLSFLWDTVALGLPI